MHKEKIFQSSGNTFNPGKYYQRVSIHTCSLSTESSHSFLTVGSGGNIDAFFCTESLANASIPMADKQKRAELSLWQQGHESARRDPNGCAKSR